MAAAGKQQRVNTPLWGHDLVSCTCTYTFILGEMGEDCWGGSVGKVGIGKKYGDETRLSADVAIGL